LSDLEKMRRHLAKAAHARSKVTYGELMKNYHLSRGRRLSQAIGEVDRAEYARGSPGFAAIVVRKDTGFPGGGYFCDEELPTGLRRTRARSSDPRLSRAEKDHVLRQQEKIWAHYASGN
jgi:hypothetical protein